MSHKDSHPKSSLFSAARMRLWTSTAALAAAALGQTVSPAAAHETELNARPVSTASQAQGAAGSLTKRLAHLPHALDLPPGLVQLSPHVPGMGEHWANPRDLPLGPVYCIMEGRVTCMEFMIAQKDLIDGKSFEELRPWPVEGVPQPPVDHMEFNYMPKGHPGFEVPHYDVHMYFVSAELLEEDKQARQAAAH